MSTHNDQTSVYVIHDPEGVPLYVGIAVDPERRFRAHRNLYGKFHGRTDVDMLVIGWLPDEESARDAEAQIQRGYTLQGFTLEGRQAASWRL